MREDDRVEQKSGGLGETLARILITRPDGKKIYQTRFVDGKTYTWNADAIEGLPQDEALDVLRDGGRRVRGILETPLSEFGVPNVDSVTGKVKSIGKLFRELDAEFKKKEREVESPDPATVVYEKRRWRTAAAALKHVLANVENLEQQDPTVRARIEQYGKFEDIPGPSLDPRSFEALGEGQRFEIVKHYNPLKR